MKRLLVFVSIILLVWSLPFSVLVPARPASAAVLGYVYDSVNVDIRILANSDIKVVETLAFDLTGSRYQYGYTLIPMDRIESVDGISVWGESGESYPYMMWRTNENQLAISWGIPKDSKVKRVFGLGYTVHGGLILDESADQLYWQAVTKIPRGEYGHDPPVKTVTVRIHFPGPVLASRVSMASLHTGFFGFFASGAQADARVVDANTVEFHIDNLTDNELLVKVTFPHGMISGTPSSWQGGVLARDARKPWITAGMLVLGVLVFPLWGTLILLKKGKRKFGKTVSTYPPGNLSPAIVGMICDTYRDGRAFAATIFDLVNRGILQIQKSGKSWLVRKIKDGEKYPFERFVTEACGGYAGKRLSEIHWDTKVEREFHVRQVESEATNQKLFLEFPSKSAVKYLWFFLPLLFVSPAILLLWAVNKDSWDYGWVPAVTVWFPVFALGSGGRWEKRTRLGIQESEAWNGFRRYLKTIRTEVALANTAEWNGYLAYAMTLDLTLKWLRVSRKNNVGVPGWFVQSSGGENKDFVRMVKAVYFRFQNSRNDWSDGDYYLRFWK